MSALSGGFVIEFYPDANQLIMRIKPEADVEFDRGYSVYVLHEAGMALASDARRQIVQSPNGNELGDWNGYRIVQEEEGWIALRVVDFSPPRNCRKKIYLQLYLIAQHNCWTLDLVYWRGDGGPANRIPCRLSGTVEALYT
jgi:hypothetical protein